MPSLKPTEKCLIEARNMRLDCRIKQWLKDDLQSFMKAHRIKSKTEGIHKYIESLKAQIEKLKAEHPNIQSLETEKPYEVECEFGTLLKAENKIHCRCTYPSIKKWLPRNRKVDLEVCQRCYPKIEGIQQWIRERKEQSMPTRPESLAEPALCTLKQQWFRDYGDFPCWKDVNFKCPNVKCEIQPRR